MQVDLMRTLRALRSCGFATIVNSKRKSMATVPAQNRAFIKAAAMIKGLNVLQLMSKPEFFKFIESVDEGIPVAISRSEGYSDEFIKLANELIMIAQLLRGEVLGMTHEMRSESRTLGDSAIPLLHQSTNSSTID